jgi:hypothetical protein
MTYVATCIDSEDVGIVPGLGFAGTSLFGGTKPDTAMKNECLLNLLCHNIVVVHQAIIELGIEPVVWGQPKAEETRDVLPMPQPG